MSKMNRDRQLQKAARSRMDRTNENYTTALKHVRAEAKARKIAATERSRVEPKPLLASQLMRSLRPCEVMGKPSLAERMVMDMGKPSLAERMVMDMRKPSLTERMVLDMRKPSLAERMVMDMRKPSLAERMVLDMRKPSLAERMVMDMRRPSLAERAMSLAERAMQPSLAERAMQPSSERAITDVLQPWRDLQSILDQAYWRRR